MLRKLYAKLGRNELGPVVGVQFTDIQLTDAGPVHLKSLTKFKLVVVRNINVTSRVVAGLKKALPNCTIVRQPVTPANNCRYRIPSCQNSETTSTLFDNQMIEVELDRDFRRHSIMKLDQQNSQLASFHNVRMPSSQPAAG